MINLNKIIAIHIINNNFYFKNDIRDNINNSYVLSIIFHVPLKSFQQFSGYKPTNNTRPDNYYLTSNPY